MTRKPVNRIVRAVTDRLWERDRLQMRIIDALLSPVEPKQRPSKRPSRQRRAKRAR